MDDEFDSPFAHVPAPNAGPSPLQEGPFTYERLAQSSGRGSLIGAGRARLIVFAVVLVVVLFGVISVLVIRFA